MIGKVDSCLRSVGNPDNSGAFDAFSIRKDFPILNRTVRGGKPLVYLDSAARSQMPLEVIEAVRQFELEHSANVHRGIHQLSDEATDAYEEARCTAAKFLGVTDPNEIVFTRNATEGLNLVAYSYGLHNLSEGDEIVISEMEHHSNLVPWLQLAKHKKLRIRFIKLTKSGELDMDSARSLIGPRTKIVSIVHLSNVLGVTNDVFTLANWAHEFGAIFVCDGSQSAAHLPVRVPEIGADFFVFSGYKVLGPTGIGVLYGRMPLLENMEPFQTGGSMINEVTLQGASWAPVPQKFEAGTPNISGAIGLSAALKYFERIGRERAHQYEEELIQYCLDLLSAIDGVEIYGSLKNRASAVSFNISGIHPHDTASILDSEGIAVRAGHHCAQPLHAALGIDSSARASFLFYNIKEDVDKLAEAVMTAKEMFAL